MGLALSTLPAGAGEETVLATLRRDGIAVLPGYLGGAALTRLNGEFDRLVETRAGLGFNVTDREEGLTIAVIRNRLSAELFPATAAAFADPFMAAIAKAYFDGAPIALNHQIYVNLNRGTTEAVAALPFLPHFDKIHTLKFFLYLSDTTRENGAMGAVVGSHVANRRHRLDSLAANPDYRAVRNVVEDADAEPVEGPAGTLFVFDTDIAHTAGHVLPGRERRIMRGHCRTLAELETLRLEREAVGAEA